MHLLWSSFGLFDLVVDILVAVFHFLHSSGRVLRKPLNKAAQRSVIVCVHYFQPPLQSCNLFLRFLRLSKCDNVSMEVRHFKPREERSEDVWEVDGINTIQAEESSGLACVSADRCHWFDTLPGCSYVIPSKLFLSFLSVWSFGLPYFSFNFWKLLSSPKDHQSQKNVFFLFRSLLIRGLGWLFREE